MVENTLLTIFDCPVCGCMPSAGHSRSHRLKRAHYADALFIYRDGHGVAARPSDRDRAGQAAAVKVL